MKRRQKSKKSKQKDGPPDTPALLQCLEQLQEDAWSQILLPKLTEAGSAANVALACSRLRALVHGNVTLLRFGPQLAGMHPAQLDTWLAPLSAHFSSCTAVQLSLALDTSYTSSFSLLPALSRLPRLQALLLNVTIPASSTVGMAMLLGAVRSQLTGLRSLSVASSASWLFGGQAAWQQLGSTTQLTRLSIAFDQPACRAFEACHLAELQTLQQLQSLSVSALDVEVAIPLQQPSLKFLSNLTALTHLHLAVPLVSGFSSVSKCRNIRCLAALAVPGVDYALSAADCAAVSQLTRLTTLALGWRLQDRAAPVLYSALQNLQQLSGVSALTWTPEVLPVFAQLAQLTRIEGGWQGAPEPQRRTRSGSGDVRCPQVTQVTAASGSIPFSAFPSLQVCTYSGSIEPSALASIPQHCSQLQSLNVFGPPVSFDSVQWTTLPLGAPRDARVAAVASLAALPFALVSLTWLAQDDTELAALALGAYNIPCISLHVPRGSAVTPCGLMQLLRMPFLQCLHLTLPGVYLSHANARMLLSGVSVRTRLVVTASTAAQAEVFKEAYKWCDESRLPAPQLELYEPLAVPQNVPAVDGGSDEESGSSSEGGSDNE